MKLNVQQNFLDKVISYVSPSKGVERYKNRATISLVDSSRSGYDQAGKSGKKFLKPYDVSSNSPDYDILTKQQGSIAMSREVYMNNSLAVSMLQRVKTTTIGTGLKLQSQIDAEFLGLTTDEARAWQKNIERRFTSWAESKDCDITRQQNFYELQDLSFFSVLLSGDCFALFPSKPVSTLTSSIRVRLVEADLCSNPYNILTGFDDKKKLAGGIELDSDGAPKTYYFSKQYPGVNLFNLSIDNWVKIPAFSESNKRQVFHMFFKERPGQRRGMPLLANLINELVKVTRLKDAELTAHVVASLFTVFIKDSSGFADNLQEGFNGGTGSDPLANSDKDANITDGDTTHKGLDTGNIVYLDEKKEVQIAESRSMNEAFEGFYTSFIKELSSAIAIPHEQLLLHFTASYSASRGALLEAWKSVRVRRAWCALNFCQPAFQAWLDEEVANRRIMAPGYFEDNELRAAWSKTSWSGMGNGQLDPLKETKAAVMRVNNNLSNHEKEYNQIHDDGDWTGNIHKRSDEEALIDTLDLQPKTTTSEMTSIEDENVVREDTSKVEEEK